MTGDATESISLGVLALVAVAGGLGAGLRFVADGLLRRALGTTSPWPTLVINIVGSAALGFLHARHLLLALDAPAWAVLATGLLGGFTTFSTAAVEIARLLAERRTAAALAIGLGGLVITVCAAAVGYQAGRY